MHTKELDTIKVILQGTPENGDHPGLITRMSKTEEFVKSLKSKVKFLGYAVGCVVLTVLGAVAQAAFGKMW